MPFASSACDNRDRQALSDDVVELTRRDVIVPAQAMVTLPSYPRFECNVIAICDAFSNLNGKRGDLRHDFHIWHADRFLLSPQNA